MCMKYFIYINTCQGCCGVLDLNCSSSLGPVDGEMEKLQFPCASIAMSVPVSLSVTKQVPQEILDKEPVDPQKL